MLSELIRKILREILTQMGADTPVSVPFPNGRAAVDHSYCILFHQITKLLRRRFFKFACARFSQKKKINSTHDRILWILVSAPSLGDILMDVSPADLLADRHVDLYATNNTAAEFLASDPRFNCVFSEINDVKRKAQSLPYDLIYLDSFSVRSLRVAKRIQPNCDLVSAFGYLNGFDVHRILFAYSRLEYLLDLPSNVIPRTMCKRSLPEVPKKPKGKRIKVAIAVGGNWKFRDYQHWLSVVELLLGSPHNVTVVLLGSENGKKASEVITGKFPGVYSYVGSTSITETSSILSQCDRLITVDSGLMHIGQYLGIPTIALFADCQLFDDSGQRVFRISPESSAKVLYDECDVSNIRSEDIYGVFNATLATAQTADRA